jgi:hypothetical protein
MVLRLKTGNMAQNEMTHGYRLRYRR